MAYLSSKLMATTAEFVPQLIKKTSDVLDASIVTRHPPDISRNDQIVGICAVPFGRESEDDLGYHFTDFLAFKALYSSLYRENQAWFSQINPEVASKTGSIHGGRDVSSAVKDYNRPITVEPNAQALVGKFMKAIMKSADNTRQHSDTLVIIACGLTSLEQDIYIVDGSDYSAVITSESIRAALDTDIKVIFITPSLTSVGWQVNPSLMHPLEVQSDPIEFMARQCGTIFGHNVVNALRSSGSPFLNRDFADAIPVMKSPVLKDSEAKLHEQGYSRLASRFIPGHGHHSFSFQLENDPWELHIGLRQGIPLTKLADQWAKLDRSESSASNGFSFLGEAFGGTRKSQLAHIDHMFKQSYNSSGYRSGSFVSVQKHFQELRHGAEHDETECHVLFNILEHKMSMMVLGDVVTKNFGLSSNFNTRCRDWNEAKWVELAKGHNKTLTNEQWAKILKCIPPLTMPYGRNTDPLKGLFLPLSGPTRYIATALTMCCTEASPRLQNAIADICNLFRKIELHLAKLLHNDSDIQRLGHAWADQVHIEGGARVSSRHRPSSLPVTGEALPDSTGCISGVFSDGNSQIPLSASAQALVSTTQNAPLTPRVKPEALPVWIDTVTGVNSVGLSTQGLSEPIEDKMREPDEQGKHVTVLPQSPAEVTRSTTPTDTPQAAVVSVPDTATRRSYSVTDTNINDDDERNLLPHQRSKVVRTSVCSANSATPVAVAAPVGQHASVACSVQGNSAVSLVGSRPEHENTPPHLRSIIKLDTIPSISYR